MTHLRNEQTRVAIAQEAKVVPKCIVVNLAPIALEEGAHEQQQRALGLVKIGDEHLHDLVSVARRYDDLRA